MGGGADGRMPLSHRACPKGGAEGEAKQRLRLGHSNVGRWTIGRFEGAGATWRERAGSLGSPRKKTTNRCCGAMSASGRRRRGALDSGFTMDETVAEYIRRTVLKIPRHEIMEMLTMWDFLSKTQLQTINVHQIKERISQEVVQLCEENSASIKQAAILDMIYNHAYRNKKIWTVYQMTKAAEEEEGSDAFNLADFKYKFKRSLRSALKNVTINFRDYEDNAIWIRIAWGTQYTKPNQYKATYVVYHSQTPYVFISSLRIRIPLLCQALVHASNYHDIHEMELRSRCLDSLKDIVFKRYSQTFQTYHPRPLQERNVAPEKVDPRIIQENKREKERIQSVNQEVFGEGLQPKIEFAQYKLETMFKGEPEMDILTEKEPFRCVVKFSSPHLLEALKSLAPAGMADAPLSPLLTCIPQKARNYFKIKERKGILSASCVGT
ncbi:centromere protein N isoform X3 [Dermochelys coriacea]|uniref:centromere protein N isoform X3 n=1 Tax=Dermochelys coriacea TaxID=27794 RepID=UPI001CA98C4F|nr:centromere protein N isoform X3 [Dermochelys coriacea]